MEIQRCSRCVLPESYPGIKFDSEGICNYCLNYFKMKYKGHGALESIISGHYSKDRRYDCVVGISGGRDSAYALFYLSKICNMRVLAYTADNGFIPEIAKENIKGMVKILEVDLVIEEHNFLKKSIKHNISSWLKKPSSAMILMVCSGCRLGMFRGLLKCAKKNKIPLIFLGSGTKIEKCDFKERLLTNNSVSNFKIIRNNKTLSLLTGLISEVFKNPRYFLKLRNAIIYIREYFYFFQQKLVMKLFYPNQKIVHLYEYIEWDEELILSTIRQELNWKQSSEDISSWRFDCRVSYLKNYLLSESIGFTEKTEILSKMVREEIISRKEALERLQKESAVPYNEIKGICEYLDLSPEDLNVSIEKIKYDS